MCVLSSQSHPWASNLWGTMLLVSTAIRHPPMSLIALRQTPGCPSSKLDAPARMTPPTAGREAPSEGPCTTTSTETKPPGSTRAPSPSGLGGWLNNLNPQKLRRVAGPYILYPVPHGMDDHCRGLRSGDLPCGHPCPHALFQPHPMAPPLCLTVPAEKDSSASSFPPSA